MEIDSLAEDLDRMHFSHLRGLYRLEEAFSTRGESGVLLCLLLGRSPMLPGELMDRTGLSTGRVANILKALQAKGWIERTRDNDDRRCIHVSLTRDGKEAACRCFDTFSEHHRALLAVLGDDAPSLLELLRRCVRICSEDPGLFAQR